MQISGHPENINEQNEEYNETIAMEIFIKLI